MGKVGAYFFGHFIAYYGLMIVLGILVSALIAYFQIKRFHLVMNNLIIICGFFALFGIIGAKILYLIISFPNIDISKLLNLNYVSSLMSGGFVFLGGILGGLLALVLCKNKLEIPVPQYVQACIGCIPIGHAFGRIGCYLVGCCYGIPYTGWFSVTYTESPFAPCGVKLFPVQLAEAAVEIGLGIILLMLSPKLKRYLGLFLYLTIYSLSRFFLEFLRYDEVRGKIAGISTSQFLCVLLFIFSALSLLNSTKHNFNRSIRDRRKE